MKKIKSKHKIKIRLVLCLILTSLFTTSCARNISGQLNDNLLRLEIKITFESPPNLNHYIYYIVFGTQHTPQIPRQLPLEYFFTPGRLYDDTQLNPQEEGITPYYTNYFSTWSDYIILTDNLTDIYNAGTTERFDPGIPPDNNRYDQQDGFNPDVISIHDNTLTIQFTLQSLSRNLNTEDTLQFTIATSDKNSPDQQSGTLIDIMDSHEPNITIPTTRTEFIDNDQDVYSENSGANITTVEARIF